MWIKSYPNFQAIDVYSNVKHNIDREQAKNKEISIAKNP